MSGGRRLLNMAQSATVTDGTAAQSVILQAAWSLWMGLLRTLVTLFFKVFFKFLRLGSALVFAFVSQGRGWSGKLAAGSQSLWPKIPVNLCIVLLCVYTVAEEG